MYHSTLDFMLLRGNYKQINRDFGMHDGVSPQPDNRSRGTWALLDIGCKSHVPPTLPAHTERPLKCHFIFFLSLSLSLPPLNLCCGAKVLVENSKELVIILNKGGCSWLPEKLTIFFPAHQTWSLSFSQKHLCPKETKGLSKAFQRRVNQRIL